MKITARKLLRSIIREAIYTGDYDATSEQLQQFSLSVKQLAKQARDLGLSDTHNALRTLCGVGSEWWELFRSGG
jgi:predicted metalloprotease with PDZ domain